MCATQLLNVAVISVLLVLFAVGAMLFLEATSLKRMRKERAEIDRLNMQAMWAELD